MTPAWGTRPAAATAPARAASTAFESLPAIPARPPLFRGRGVWPLLQPPPLHPPPLLRPQVIGCSVDSHFTHLAWVNTPRAKGGLGGCQYPLVADLTKQIAKDYGVLIEDGDDAGVSLRWAADSGCTLGLPCVHAPLCGCCGMPTMHVHELGATHATAGGLPPGGTPALVAHLHLTHVSERQARR